MKPSVLAILWLARLAEVGYRHWPKESSSSETGYVSTEPNLLLPVSLR